MIAHINPKKSPEPIRITDSKRIISDEDLKKFLNINGIKNRDEELIRDILVISRIYDRNFDRLMVEENPLKRQTYKLIEDFLNKASVHMRNIATIGCGEIIK